MLYDRPPGLNPESRSGRGEGSPWGRFFAIVLWTIAVAVGVHRLTGRPQKAAAPPKQSAVAREESTLPSPVEASPSSPRLGESDAFVRDRVRSLSDEPEWSIWISEGDLARRFVASVLAVSEGRSPRQHLAAAAPRGAFAVSTVRNGMAISRASFARYDRVAAVIGSLDPEHARPVWKLLHPLLERAWREIAPPDLTLDSGAARALDHLIATPLLEGEIAVVPDGDHYRFADPRLEALTPAQKHLVRMGKANASKVIESLRGLRQLLEG